MADGRSSMNPIEGNITFNLGGTKKTPDTTEGKIDFYTTLHRFIMHNRGHSLGTKMERVV